MKKHRLANGQVKTEIGLAAQIRTYFNSRGWSLHRHNNSGQFNPRKAKDMMSKLYDATARGQCSPAQWAKAIDAIFAQSWSRTPLTEPGISDLIGFAPDGRFVAIEIKMPGDRLSESQSMYLYTVKKAGGIAYVAHDLQKTVADLTSIYHQTKVEK